MTCAGYSVPKEVDDAALPDQHGLARLHGAHCLRVRRRLRRVQLGALLGVSLGRAAYGPLPPHLGGGVRLAPPARAGRYCLPGVGRNGDVVGGEAPSPNCPPSEGASPDCASWAAAL